MNPSMQKKQLNSLSITFTNSTDYLLTSYLIADLNSDHVSGKHFSILLRLNLAYQHRSILSLMVKLKELIRYLNNSFAASATMNKTIGHRYFLMQNSLTNNSIHTAIKASPFFSNYGFNPRADLL